MLISPEELATIVHDLLTDPDSVGELDEPHKFEQFFRDVAQAVCDSCGGRVGFVSSPDFNREDFDRELSEKDEDLFCDAMKWMVHIQGNDSLPSPNTNIWRHHGFDPTGRLEVEGALPEEERL